MSRKIVFLALSIVTVAAAADWIRQESKNDKPSAVAERMPAAVFSGAQAPTKNDELLFSPQAGQIYTYNFQRHIAIKGLDNNFPAIEYAGELNLNIIGTDDKGFSAIVSERVAGQKATDVALKIWADKKGETIKISSRKNVPEGERQHESIEKDLLSLLLFPMRADTFGGYTAAFETLPAEKGYIRWKKTKIAYLQAKNAPKIISSLHQLKWSQALGLPELVEGEESTEMGTKDTRLSSEGTYALHFLKMAKADKIDAALLAGFSQNNSLALSTDGAKKNHPEYAKLNWATLSAQLKDIESLSAADKLKLFGDLVKLLQVDGSKVADMLALLKSQNAIGKGAESATYQAVVGALATAGTAEALSALRELYADGAAAVSGKGSILGALTTTQAALDADTRSFLAETMANETNKDLANGAAFALGSSLEQASDAQAKNAIDQILAAWRGAASLQDRLALIDTMGNSGRAEFFPALALALNQGPEPEIKAKAAFALRFIKITEAVQLLGSSLAHLEVGVRYGAAAGIQMASWNEAFRQPVGTCSNSEPDTQVRSICHQIAVSPAAAVANAN